MNKHKKDPLDLHKSSKGIKKTVKKTSKKSTIPPIEVVAIPEEIFSIPQHVTSYTMGGNYKITVPFPGGLQIPIVTNYKFTTHKIVQNVVPKRRKTESKLIKLSAIEDRCVLCLETPADCHIIPCNHACVCNECYKDMEAKDISLCPICRQKIVNVVYRPIKK